MLQSLHLIEVESIIAKKKKKKNVLAVLLTSVFHYSFPIFYIYVCAFLLYKLHIPTFIKDTID